MGKATQGKKRIELLHDIMEGRDYGQLKDLISDRSRWRQDSQYKNISETCWKQQKTKERRRAFHSYWPKQNVMFNSQCWGIVAVKTAKKWMHCSCWLLCYESRVLLARKPCRWSFVTLAATCCGTVTIMLKTNFFTNLCSVSDTFVCSAMIIRWSNYESHWTLQICDRLVSANVACWQYWSHSYNIVCIWTEKLTFCGWYTVKRSEVNWCSQKCPLGCDCEKHEKHKYHEYARCTFVLVLHMHVSVLVMCICVK